MANQTMTNVRTRMIAMTAVCMLWLFAAPVLFIYSIRLMGMPSGKLLTPIEFFYSAFFFITWLYSVVWIYIAFFWMLIPRWPRARDVAEIIAIIAIILIYAFACYN